MLRNRDYPRKDFMRRRSLGNRFPTGLKYANVNVTMEVEVKDRTWFESRRNLREGESNCKRPTRNLYHLYHAPLSRSRKKLTEDSIKPDLSQRSLSDWFRTIN